ncbi:DUF3182 domain-containing protein, partial [Bordetella bronchiseptica]
MAPPARGGRLSPGTALAAAALFPLPDPPMNPAAAVPRRPVDLVVAHPGRRDAPRHERASLR